MQQPDPQLEQSAIRLLADREHSRAELRRKLRDKGSADEIDDLVDRLAARGYQSDERFTEQYVAMRRRKGYGPLRIRAELRERGIDGAQIDAWLDQGDDEWLAALSEVARQKFGEALAANQKEQARRARFLEYRGFPPALIRTFLWNRE